MINRENLYLSTLAFIDEDSVITNERYLLEFCKLVVYQNGYDGLKLDEICEKIKALVLFEYTEEEIEKVIKNKGGNEIICVKGVYSITSEVEQEIKHREKTFGLRKHIDIFCDLKRKDISNYSRDDLCNLIMKFLFEKFQQSIEQIYFIIDGNKENILEYSEQYSEEEKSFINSFLTWDNEEKNVMVYNLIVKSYDFCTLNCGEKTSFDFSKFHFYLDANIIMRLLGINNAYRQNAVNHFIDKCKKEKINLHVSNFTKEEILKSIDRQVAAIAKEIRDMGYMPQPTAMKFAKLDTFTIEMYGKYFEYCNKNKSRSYEGFKQYLHRQLESCIKAFLYDDEISFEATETEKFSGLVKSLKQIKDEKVVRTDINNILLVCKKRTENTDSYMISADAKLIDWCKQIFIGKTSIVEYPSVWLSLIMKYTGRASGNDYASFCRFIRLPINATDKNIKEKIEVRKKVINMDVSNQIKDRMLEELEGNFINYYQEYSIEEIPNKVYTKIMEEHDKKIRDESEKHKEEVIKRITEKHELTNANLIKQLKEKEMVILEQEKNLVEVKVQREIEKIISKKIEKGEWINNHRSLLIVITIIILIILSVGVFAILKRIGSITLNEGIFGLFLSIISIIIEFLIINIINAIQEELTNEEELKKRYTKKIKKKYKNLL